MRMWLEEFKDENGKGFNITINSNDGVFAIIFNGIFNELELRIGNSLAVMLDEYDIDRELRVKHTEELLDYLGSIAFREGVRHIVLRGNFLEPKYNPDHAFGYKINELYKKLLIGIETGEQIPGLNLKFIKSPGDPISQCSPNIPIIKGMKYEDLSKFMNIALEYEKQMTTALYDTKEKIVESQNERTL